MTTKKSFHQLETELETLLVRIEHGSYENIEDMLKDHKAAEFIIDELEKRLKSAETKITNVEKSS